MDLKYYYWYFKSVIPSKLCKDIIAHGLKQSSQPGTTLQEGKARDLKKNPLSKEEAQLLKKKRDSKIAWLGDKWIYKEIQPYVHHANKLAGWNFQWDWSEPCQFSSYTKGQYYGWHSDGWYEPRTQEGPMKGKIRKLTLGCHLSDPSTYKGGELEFDWRQHDPDKKQKNTSCICKEAQPQGSIVVFPSFVWHRVKPVMKGVRYSLLMWNLGYPFK